ncbi:MAG: hypothetical protein R2834_21000 [Rhodothermales bacterium]
MKRLSFSSLIVIAATSLFWALVVADTLVRQMDTGVTYIDLAAVFVLGAISGTAAGAAYVMRHHDRAVEA